MSANQDQVLDFLDMYWRTFCQHDEEALRKLISIQSKDLTAIGTAEPEYANNYKDSIFIIRF